MAKHLSAQLEAQGPFQPMADLKAAEALWAMFRHANGLSNVAVPLITEEAANVKLAKSEGMDVMPVGVSLSPANVAGIGTTCAYSTPGCRALCLASAGKGGLTTVQEARKVRTLFLAEHPEAFLAILVRDLHKAQAKARKAGRILGVRLNILSDLRWEAIAPCLFDMFGDAMFYDYTKWPMALRYLVPSNYHLTYSATERTTYDQIATMVDMGVNVAVPVAIKRSEPIPATLYGVPAIDGDKHDVRPLDPKGVVVALRPKGAARKAEAGEDRFVKGVC